ncbi:SAM domain (Sterile alpha motif) domain containing protein [Acanthamoeba castellanii str. Neff]|uniref:SAM domain (Sterile alpha motif) domain containing protein n=1 Tax=Acanthamoeba castellanii (strain ATCC 30010 / Neff) TaxID=1257118 RepID=L8GGR6_ACACF|nr:SAM domain (Sterile alpha motif) domain containing protein [Acanthamoeba castellanii str. Neff]ELR12152.1 SAM domain (Sterile alpha motif) domain containing protein [Acanthamoeba castellanii str. Neff]
MSAFPKRGSRSQSKLPAMPEFSDSDDEGPPSEGHNSGEYKVFGCQEGFLTTQGEESTNKWIRGWIKLEDNTMLYYPSQTAREPTMMVTLCRESEVRTGRKVKDLMIPYDLSRVFVVKDSTNEMIVFVADSEAEKRVWLAEVGRTITSLIDPYLKKKHPRSWSVYEVSLWLEMIGFGAYKSEFDENRITGKLLLSLTKLDLKALSISKLGHRLRFLKYLDHLRANLDTFDDASLYDDTLSSVDSAISIGQMEPELLVKCLYNKETRCVRIREGSSYKDLQKQLEKEFKFVPVIKYKDPEGDKVSMKKQGDFEYALSLINGNALRLYIAKKHKRVK